MRLLLNQLVMVSILLVLLLVLLQLLPCRAGPRLPLRIARVMITTISPF